MVWPDCFRLYILLQKRVDIFLRQTCKWIFLSFPYECELFLIPFPQKHEKCAFIISMATCIVPVALLICSNTTSVTDSAVRASLWSSLQEFTVILQKSSSLSRARLGNETEVLHGPPPSFPIPPTPGYHWGWFTLSTRVSEVFWPSQYYSYNSSCFADQRPNVGIISTDMYNNFYYTLGDLGITTNWVCDPLRPTVNQTLSRFHFSPYHCRSPLFSYQCQWRTLSRVLEMCDYAPFPSVRSPG